MVLIRLLLCSAPSLMAQGGREVTLEDALALAMESNFDLKIAKNNVTVAVNEATKSEAGLTPTLSVGGNGSYASNDTKAEYFGTIPPNDEKGAVTTMYGTSVDLSWTIFDGFYSINNLKKLQNQVRLANVQEQIDIENVIVNTAEAYFNLLIAQNDIALARETFDLSKERLKETERDLSLGSGSETEHLNALTAYQSDSLQLLSRENQRRKMIANLIMVTGSDQLGEDIEPIAEVDLLALAYSDLIGQVQTRSSRILQSGSNLDIATLQYEMSKASRFPRLSLSAGYGFDRSDYEIGLMEYNQSAGWSTGVNLSYNLFDFGKRKRDIANARLSLENSQLLLDQMELETVQNFNMTWSDYELHVATINLETEKLSIEEERFERLRTSYNLGQSTGLSFRDAQLSLYRAKSSLYLARINAKLSEFELLRLAGVLVK